MARPARPSVPIVTFFVTNCHRTKVQRSKSSFHPALAADSTPLESPEPGQRTSHFAPMLCFGLLLLAFVASDILDWRSSRQWELVEVDEGQRVAQTAEGVSPPYPGGRGYGLFAHIPETDDFLLFGGFGMGAADTWLYHMTPHAWEKLTMSISPPLRLYIEPILPYPNTVALSSGSDFAACMFDMWLFNLTDTTWKEVSNPGVQPTVCSSRSVWQMKTGRGFRTAFGFLTPETYGGGNPMYGFNWADDDPLSGTWSNQPTQGNPSFPSARAYALTWTDYAGSAELLYVYGGRADVSTYFSDVYSYDVGTWTWTEVVPDGPDSATFSPAAATYQGARAYSNLPVELPEKRCVFIFGGFAFGETAAADVMGDMWRFDLDTHSFDFVSLQLTDTANPATQGPIFSGPARNPGQRYAHMATRRSGTFEMYIGFGFRAGILQYAADLWKLELYEITCDGIDASAGTAVCGGHGNCVLIDICECDDYDVWGGQYCDEPVCFGLTNEDVGEVCGGLGLGGVCVGLDECECPEEGAVLSVDGTVCVEKDDEGPGPGGGGGLNIGIIVGGAVGGVVFVGLVLLFVIVMVVLICCCCRRASATKKNLGREETETYLGGNRNRNRNPVSAAAAASVSAAAPPTTSSLSSPRRTPSLHEEEEMPNMKPATSSSSSSLAAKFAVDKSLFTVQASDVELLEQIGKGGGGAVVYRAKWSGRIVAYKNWSQRQLRGEESLEFEKEAMLASSLRHPSILTFFGCCLDSRVGILMEFCSNGDLDVYLARMSEEGTPVSVPVKIRMLTEIAQGMGFLHSKNIVHRDLKPGNVLLDEGLHAKLMDFGLSRVVVATSKMTTRIGTPGYMAPELVLGQSYSCAVDVFAYGILLYEVMSEIWHPYGMAASVSGNLEFQIANDPTCRPDLARVQHLPRSLVTMMPQCWSHDPHARPSFEKIQRFLDQAAFESGKGRESGASSRYSRPSAPERRPQERSGSGFAGRQTKLSAPLPRKGGSLLGQLSGIVDPSLLQGVEDILDRPASLTRRAAPPPVPVPRRPPSARRPGGGSLRRKS